MAYKTRTNVSYSDNIKFSTGFIELRNLILIKRYWLLCFGCKEGLPVEAFLWSFSFCILPNQ